MSPVPRPTSVPSGRPILPLGLEVDLGAGDIVLDGDSAPPKKGHGTSTFRPMSVVAKRLDGPRCHLVGT